MNEVMKALLVLCAAIIAFALWITQTPDQLSGEADWQAHAERRGL